MNKFFINQQNGTRPSVISRLWWAVGLLLLVSSWGSLGPQKTAQAAATSQTYTQPFHPTASSLAGQAVVTSGDFTTTDYWRLSHVTLTLAFQVSPLTDQRLSAVTVSLNGTPVTTFRPQHRTSVQTRQVTLPVSAVRRHNVVKLSGQLQLTSDQSSDATTSGAANWLTVMPASSVTCAYTVGAPGQKISTFYERLTGLDTISQQRAAVILPDQVSDAELQAGMLAVTGGTRFTPTVDQQLPVTTADTAIAKKATYQIVLATYDHLPARFQHQISRTSLGQTARIQRYDAANKHYLIVTAPNAKLLAQAGRYLANAELLRQATHASTTLTAQSAVLTPETTPQNEYALTTTADRLVGATRQERDYFVKLPVDRVAAAGSTIQVKLRYAKNLDFQAALATVSVNGQSIGSHRLTARHADGETFSVRIPQRLAVGHDFTVRVALDLPVATSAKGSARPTPWAIIEPGTAAHLKSTPADRLLFAQYPGLFLQQGAYDHLAVVRPRQLTAADYQTLSRVFALLGHYVDSNRGQLQFYHQRPHEDVLKTANVIALGTPRQNPLIHDLNDHLYFQFNTAETRVVANEKLSVEPRYGATLGTAQLLRSPYNDRRGLLVVTGATPDATVRAATHLSTPADLSVIGGDALVVDADNVQRHFRFQRQAPIDPAATAHHRLTQNRQLGLYLGIAAGVMAVISLALVLLWRKHRGLRHRGGTRYD